MPADRLPRRSLHLAEPPEHTTALRRFPASRLTPNRDLYRVHRADLDPRFFDSAGSGRFDLTGGREGTCYLTLDPTVAVVEVLYGINLVPAGDLAMRSVSTLRVQRPVRLADCTSSRAVSFGVTAEIHTSTDYELTQRWAAALRAAGFGGVRYWARHDPGKGHSIALFGRAGARAIRVTTTSAIDDVLQARVSSRYGLAFLPTDIDFGA